MTRSAVGPAGPRSTPGGLRGLYVLSQTAGNAAVSAVLRAAGGREVGASGARNEGVALPPVTRARIETMLGVDLGTVRVHAGPEAGDASLALDAAAFTAGRHIFFAPGRYQPGTPAGEQLLAHEATHVVQQGFRDPWGAHGAEPLVDSERHEAQAGRVAAGSLRLRAATPLPPVCGIQRQAAAPAAAQQTPAVLPPTPDPGLPPPVLFGFDMSTRPGTPYVSVTLPGHSLLEVTSYLYGDADPTDSLRTQNGDLPEHLPAGRTLHFDRQRLTPVAARAFDDAIRSGTVLRSQGMPQDSAEVKVYRATIGGRELALTEDQFVSMLRGGAMWVSFRAQEFKGEAEVLRDTQASHVAESDPLIRWTSDRLGGVSLPAYSIYEEPIAAAQRLIDHIAAMEITPESGPEIGALLPSLVTLDQQVSRARRAWHEYIEGTISGAGRGAEYAEITRNVAFATVAGLAGAVAAPAVFAAAGGGLVGGGLAIGGGALAGGLVRGGLEVAAPGMHAGESMGQRFTRGFESGAEAGAFGAVGGMVAPGVSGAISSRVFGVAPEALSAGARIAVNALTGAAIGAPSGAASAAGHQFQAWRSGQISGTEYLRRIGWGGAEGAATGGAFGAIPLPVRGLYRTGGMRFNPFSGEPVTPSWLSYGAPGVGGEPAPPTEHPAPPEATPPAQAAAKTPEDLVEALRRQPSAPDGAGPAWDHDRFPNGPNRRWQPGDPIDMPSVTGEYPSYESGEVRRRYWRNRAYNELEARARGEVTRDVTNRTNPMRSMSDDQLRALRDTPTSRVRAPADPITGRTLELEHGVPQRVQRWLEDAGFQPSEARRLAGVASPGRLMEVTPTEHAFFDVEAWGFGSRRADITGARWSGTPAADIRGVRPLADMSDQAVTTIVQEIRVRGLNLSANANAVQLRAALQAEITARGLPLSLP